MSGAKLKSIGIFIVIMLLLSALVVGGVRMIKDRNIAYAENKAKHGPVQVATGKDTKGFTPQPQVQQPPQAAPKPVPSEESKAASNPAELRDKPLSPAPVSASRVPATGPSLLDVPLTSVFMMIAAYYGVNFLKARARFRRILL